PPLVLNTRPDRGAEIGPTDPLEITFDQPMDADSVAEAFALQPPTDGELLWVSDTTLRFTPAKGYRRGERYRLTIAESARSAAGLPLNRPVELTFETTGNLEVGGVQPADGSEDIALDATVTVLFNRPVVPLTALENQAALPQPLTFVPPVRGTGEWLNTAIYRFTPAGGFDPATTYTARVAAGLTAADGSTLQEDYVWTFSTLAPAVVATYPDDESLYVSPTPVISLTFNQPMDRASVEAAFRLESTITGERVPGSFRWAETGLRPPRSTGDGYYGYLYSEGAGPETVGVETVAFLPDHPLERGGSYDAILTTVARGRKGNQANLERTYRFGFFVAPNLSIVDTYPADGSTTATPYDNLQVTFSTPVDPKSFIVGKTIRISPPVAITRVYTYFWDNQTEFNLSFPTEASTAYTVTLGADITDRYGQPLGEEAVIHWRTTPYEPSVFIHSPGNVGFYSAYTPTLAYLSVRNVRGVNLHLYRLPEEDFLRLNGEDSWREARNYQPDPENLLRSWRLETAPPLNQTALYTTNLAGDDDATLEPGLYYLLADVSKDDVYPQAAGLGELPRYKQILVVSNYNLTMKTTANETMAWLTDLRTTEPVAGANIVFRLEGLTLDRIATDGDGVAIAHHHRLDPWKPRFAISHDPFAIAVSEWSQGIERWNYGFATEDFLQPYNAHLYTDRAIYRPGQTVYFKGIFRTDDDAHYTLPAVDKPVKITVYDGQGKQIFHDQYTLNENGTIHGQVELDEEASLGAYFIQADYRDNTFGKDFVVAEYRKPEFVVDVTTDKPEYVNGETILLTARASYFFGGAVAEAPVRYTILSEDYFFRYTGPGGYYDFTDYDFSRSRGADFVPGFGEVIAEGKGVTNADGVFTLEVPADIADRLASQRFTLEVTVTDPDSRQEVSNRVEAIVHKGDFYIGLRPERYIGVAGEESTLHLRTVDWESQPAPGKELTVIVYEHRWYSVKVQGEDGRYYWDSVVEDTPIFTTTTTTDDEGRGEIAFTPKKGGVHKIEARGVDTAGNLVRSSTFMWVSGRGYINWRQENNDRIELVTDKREYNVGDVATILIPHPYSGTVRALVTQERGHIYHYEVMTLPTNSEQIQIPITEDMLPNMFVSVVILKGPGEGQPIPGFKVGYAQLPINVKEKEIQITLTPDKPEGESYAPGDEVTYTIEATDAGGKPVQAEFSLALVDKAILSLADDSGDSLLERFWRQRGLGVGTATSLAISAERVNLAVAPEAKGGGGGGLGEPFAEVRGDFRDTAFWVADFTTDENGRGTVTARLPDNLTTWVLTARGITRDTLVGDKRVEIVSTKPLLVRPVAPRFFVVGDEAQLKMIVQNNTRQDLTVETRFEGEGVTLVDTPASAEVTIEAGGKATVAYPVKVGLVSTATLRFGAAGGGYQDAVALSLPVYRHSTPETTGTAGVLDADGARLEGIALPARYDPSQGGLTVKIEPSLAAGMRGGLKYLEHFPYECTEQTVSRFLPNVVTYRAYRQLGLDNPQLAEKLPALVSTGLQRLYAQQHPDGGWGWWSTEESNPYLTAYVVLGMVEAERAGFAVEEEVLFDALDFLRDSLRRPKDVRSNWQANRQAFILYVMAEAGAGDLSRTINLFEQREKLDLFGRAFLAMTFGLLEPDDNTRLDTLLSDLTAEAVVSATGAHWEEAQPDYYSMNTDTRSTAIVIAALSRLQPDNPLLPNAVRWLMSVRQRDRWETTQETAWAIIGLTDWMVATQELQGNYAWAVSLNGESLGEGTVGAANIDEVTTLTVAVGDLLAETVNRLVIERAPQEGEAASLGRLYYTAHLEYYKPVEEVKALERGI
ncbi:MAG: hypothetical protein D6796_05370, partial [Caldilineae bacterium]